MSSGNNQYPDGENNNDNNSSNLFKDKNDMKFLEDYNEYWQYIYDEFGLLNFIIES